MFDGTDDERDRDRGQVGIGTLIVFIAMVLVAAIAAGVLINTAGFLQSSAEQSGQQAAEEVTNRLVEVNTVGEVGQADVDGDGNDENAVTSVQITARLASGSSDVDLDGVTMQWVTAGTSQNLISANSDDAGSGNEDGVFTYEYLRDDDSSISSDNTLNDGIDRAIIEIGLNGDSSGDADPSPGSYIDSPLATGETATMTISTQSGGETTITLTVPDSLSQTSSVDL